MKGTLNKPSLNPLLQCVCRAQEIGGLKLITPNHLSFTHLRQNGIAGLCVKVVNFFLISTYGPQKCDHIYY